MLSAFLDGAQRVRSVLRRETLPGPADRVRGAKRTRRSEQRETVPAPASARQLSQACTRPTRCPATCRPQTPSASETAPRRHSAARSPRSPRSRSTRLRNRTRRFRALARSCTPATDGPAADGRSCLEHASSLGGRESEQRHSEILEFALLPSALLIGVGSHYKNRNRVAQLISISILVMTPDPLTPCPGCD